MDGILIVNWIINWVKMVAMSETALNGIMWLSFLLLIWCNVIVGRSSNQMLSYCFSLALSLSLSPRSFREKS